MNDWRKLSENQYSYRGFDIHYSMENINRRAVDDMRATKEIINEQREKEKILFQVTGDDFEATSLKITKRQSN